MKNFLLFFLISVCFYPSVLAKQTTDSLQAEMLFKKTKACFNEAAFDSAVYYSRRASKAFEKIGNWENALLCKNTEAYALTYSHDLQGAARLFKDNIEQWAERLGGSSSEYIMTYAHLSHAIKKLGYLDSALYYSTLAVSLAENYPKMDSTLFARVYLAIANTQVAKFQLDEALMSIKKGLYIKKHQQDSLDTYTQELTNTLANVFFYKKNFDRALIHYRRALRIAEKVAPDNRSYPAMYLSNLGLCHMLKRDLDSASYFLEMSLKIRIDLFGEESMQASRVYENLGFIHSELGEPDRAISYYRQALRSYEKNLQPQHPRIGSVMSHISFENKKKGDYERALAYLRKSIENIVLNYGKTNRLADAYKDLAGLFAAMGDHSGARRSFEKATDIALSQSTVDSIAVADILSDKADFEINTRHYNNAFGLLQGNLNIYRSKFGEKDFNVSETYLKLGELKTKTANFDSALFYYQEGIKAIVTTFDASDYRQNPALGEQIINENVLLEAIKGKAEVLHLKYLTSQDVEYAKACLKTSELGAKLLSRIRNHYSEEDSKLNLADSRLYELGISSGLSLYESQTDDSYLIRAFDLSERSKSAVLRSTMIESRARSFSQIPDSLFQLENDLRAEKSFLKNQLDEETVESPTNSAKVNILQEKLFAVSRKHEQLIEQFESQFPKYYELKYKDDLMGLNTILADLNDSQLISYHLGESTLYTFVVSPSGISVKQFHIDRLVLQETIKQLKTSITSQNLADFSKHAVQLYQWLVLPIRGQLDKRSLIIIPDGALLDLNFELLLEEASSSVSYQDQHYLLKKFAISYAYSANLLLAQNQGSKTEHRRQEVLAFSFGADDPAGKQLAMRNFRSRAMEDLPGSRTEIRMISKIFDGQYFYGQRASEASFKSLAGKFAILHLALHGQSNMNRPNSSNLQFTPVADSLEDGQLYAYELYSMELPAELAVLSACNTGIGQLVSGEGMMTMGRAFTYAGCKSLVYTQWEIPDESSPVLMEYFYQGLKAGKPKNVALREAKVAFLDQANPSLSSPLYWGGFVLQGNTDALDQSNPFHMNRSLMLLAGALLALTFVYFKSKR